MAVKCLTSIPQLYHIHIGQYGMKAMCTAHVPCTKASAAIGAQIGAQLPQ